MSHTPGPWYVSVDLMVRTENEGGAPIASVWEDFGPIKRGLDNARLIAAAPDLYRELQKARDNLQVMVSEGILEYYDFDAIDAAIAKVSADE